MQTNCLKDKLDKEIISCKKCGLHELNFNKNKIELGYGKLVGKEGKISNQIIVVGLNPSHNRFKNLSYPFDADMKSEKDNDGKTFMKLLMRLGVYDFCYITNAIKCSTENNKVDDESFEYCKEYFIEEFKLTYPDLIIACGNQTYNYIFSILQLLTNIKDVKLDKIFHPSYCFSYKRIAIKDYILHVRDVFKRNGMDCTL